MTRVLCTIVEARNLDGLAGAWDPDTGTIWLHVDVRDRLVTVLHELLHWLLGHDDSVDQQLHDAVEAAAAVAAELLVKRLPELASFLAVS